MCDIKHQKKVSSTDKTRNSLLFQAMYEVYSIIKFWSHCLYL